MDEGVSDDDECTPRGRQAKQPTQAISTSERNERKRTTFDILPVLSQFDIDKDDDECFDRVFSSTPQSTTRTTNKRKIDELDSSSISASSDSEYEGAKWLKSKENLVKKNVNLASLQNKKPRKKKNRKETVIVQQSSDDYKFVVSEIDLLKKRLSKLEKRRTSTSGSQVDVADDISTKIKEIFGIHPTMLKSPINRPTKIVRELFKNTGHELFKWKELIEPNEQILKDKTYFYTKLSYY
ncbi:unnamed protein product [Rotaria sp. Silwood2]|nr:unnamed protein product [Rotaria sp. Silwood2]CAF4352124.1 unnamed protein product [Rotaria sp. Silwood2]